MDEYESCPRCNTNKKQKPHMKLMINVCAHSLCDTCVEQLFFRGSAPCPKCQKVLKKSEFRDQVFEDTYIEKETALRRKLIKDLTRTENEFMSLREFNDYLETVETLIFNLANNIDEEESVKKLDQLKKEAKDSHKNRNQFKMEKKKENPLYTYRPLSFYTHGPSVPPVQELIQEYARNMLPDPSQSKQLLAHVQLASGFASHIPVRRLLEDAYADLFLTVRDYPTS